MQSSTVVYEKLKNHTSKIGIVGLGYVGLPLAVALGKSFKVVGFDINYKRLEDLRASFDATGETDSELLRGVRDNVEYTNDAVSLRDCSLVIICVPTPTMELGTKVVPDFTPVMKASQTVGANVSRGTIICYESTVYPTTTEIKCVDWLIEGSGGSLKRSDFYLGYSPERINPGDKQHHLTNTTKLVAGESLEVTRLLEQVYGSVTNTYACSSIQVAEMAKLFENVQRDVNIALMNEVSLFAEMLNISMTEVSKACSTKWNFYPVVPGLVQGHCIKEDPYYLLELAEKYSVNLNLVKQAREINESMPKKLVATIMDFVRSGSRIAILGATYKEDVRDIRNSKVVQVAEEFLDRGASSVEIFDPFADPEEFKHEFLWNIIQGSAEKLVGEYDAVLLLVKHSIFKSELSYICKHLKPGGWLLDFKSMFNASMLPEGYKYWSL